MLWMVALLRATIAQVAFHIPYDFGAIPFNSSRPPTCQISS